MDLTFILTEDCNLRCRYCYQPRFQQVVMPREIGAEAIHAAVEHGARKLSLTFFGGEPLLEADTLFSLLEEARRIEVERGIPVTAKMATNGLLLSDDIVARAKALGLFISLSFDGVRASQDSGRIDPEGGSSFERVEEALERLAASNYPFAVYSVITPDNVEYLTESRKYLWGKGARLLIATPDYTAEWKPADIRTLKRQLGKTGRYYEQLLKKKETFHFEPFDSRISQRTRFSEYRRCSPGVTQLTIAPDGVLYGCIEYFHRRMAPLGNVSEWLDPRAVRALSQARGCKPAECMDCSLESRCLNTCACVNLRGTDMVNVPSSTQCALERETIQAVDAVAARLYKNRNPEFLLRQYSASYHLLSGIESHLKSLEENHEPATPR